MLSGISHPFEWLSRFWGQVTHVLLTRSPLYSPPEGSFRARLACVRHAASVRSEPGSNSPVSKQHLVVFKTLDGLDPNQRDLPLHRHLFSQCQRPKWESKPSPLMLGTQTIMPHTRSVKSFFRVAHRKSEEDRKTTRRIPFLLPLVANRNRRLCHQKSLRTGQCQQMSDPKVSSHRSSAFGSHRF